MKTQSKRKPRSRPYIPRKEYRFWLRKDRDADNRLIEFIQYCKSTRQFARVVRDGIRLIWSLREGNTDVLFELFPHLETRLASHFTPPAHDPGDLERIISASVQSSVQAAMMNLPSLPATIPVAAPLKSSGTLAAAKTLEIPVFDDDDQPTMIITPVAIDTVGNFFASMGLSQAHVSETAGSSRTRSS